jgi:hypothetical protein
MEMSDGEISSDKIDQDKEGVKNPTQKSSVVGRAKRWIVGEDSRSIKPTFPWAKGDEEAEGKMLYDSRRSRDVAHSHWMCTFESMT